MVARASVHIRNSHTDLTQSWNRAEHWQLDDSLRTTGCLWGRRGFRPDDSSSERGQPKVKCRCYCLHGDWLYFLIKIHLGFYFLLELVDRECHQFSVAQIQIWFDQCLFPWTVIILCAFSSLVLLEEPSNGLFDRCPAVKGHAERWVETSILESNTHLQTARAS